MQILSNEQLYSISGGQEDSPLSSFNPCSIAVINFLKNRNDLLEALLSQDVNAQIQSSTQMHYHQKIAVENCSFEDMRNTGVVGSELFLF